MHKHAVGRRPRNTIDVVLISAFQMSLNHPANSVRHIPSPGRLTASTKGGCNFPQLNSK